MRFAGWVLVLGMLLGTSGCGRIEKVLTFGVTAQGIDRSVVLDPPGRAKKASCVGKLVNDDLLAPPPSLPTLDDSSWLRGRAQPGYSVYLGWVVAEDTRLQDLREVLVQDGLSRGYEVDASPWRDRVLTIRYGGRADVTLSVQPYCRGRLALRYVVGAVDSAPVALPDPPTAKSRPCPELERPEQVSREQALLPLPPAAVPLLVGADGDAVAFTAVAPGTDLEDARDALVPRLVDAGYVVAAPVSRGPRSQAALVGRHTGALTVQPWCRGQLVVRYLLTPYVDPEDQAGRSKRPCAGRDAVETPADSLPAWLTYPGQQVVAERTATSFQAWTARRTAITVTGLSRGPGALTPVLSASRQALDEVTLALTTGGVRKVPVAGPVDLAAAGLSAPPDTALLAVAPVCLNTVAETYVVVR